MGRKTMVDKDEIIRLRKKNISFIEIGKRVGCSYQYAIRVAGDIKAGPRHVYARELEALVDRFKAGEFKNRSVEEISASTGLPQYRVKTARKLANGVPINRTVINLNRRRNHLCKFLFGDYRPGINFVSFLSEFIEGNMPKAQAELVQDFYLSGTSEDNSGYSRYYRAFAKNKLKGCLEDHITIAEMIEEGVIK